MHKLVTFVEKKANIKSSVLKPLFGKNAFLTTHDFHAVSVVKGVWEASYSIDPKLLGITSRLAVFDKEL